MMLIEPPVDSSRDTSNRDPVPPGEEVCDIGLAMIRVVGSEKPREAEDPAAEQVAAQRRCPAGVIAIQAPGQFGEWLQPRVSESNFLDLYVQCRTSSLFAYRSLVPGDRQGHRICLAPHRGFEAGPAGWPHSIAEKTIVNRGARTGSRHLHRSRRQWRQSSHEKAVRARI
jgi:hypothetical protein